MPEGVFISFCVVSGLRMPRLNQQSSSVSPCFYHPRQPQGKNETCLKRIYPQFADCRVQKPNDDDLLIAYVCISQSPS